MRSTNHFSHVAKFLHLRDTNDILSPPTTTMTTTTTNSVPPEEEEEQEETKSKSSSLQNNNNNNPFWWNTNLPPSQHTPTCPPYLEYAFHNLKDRTILSTPDALYTPQTWPEVQSLIRENRLDLFQRVPSELRLYREFCADVGERYGSVREFVVRERLGWEGDGGGVDAEGEGEGENADGMFGNSG